MRISFNFNNIVLIFPKDHHIHGYYCMSYQLTYSYSLHTTTATRTTYSHTLSHRRRYATTTLPPFNLTLQHIQIAIYLLSSFLFHIITRLFLNLFFSSSSSLYNKSISQSVS